MRHYNAVTEILRHLQVMVDPAENWAGDPGESTDEETANVSYSSRTLAVVC